MTILEKQVMEAIIRAAQKYSHKEIDWEQREWELAKELFLKGKDAEESIETAIVFVKAFKRRGL